MEKFTNKQKGITLIALIITIIVMLILVAVTINVAINGGLFERAKKAQEDTQREADREELLSYVIGSYDEFGNFNGDTFYKKLSAPQTGWKVTKNADGTFTCISPKNNEFMVDAKGNITVTKTNTGEGGETNTQTFSEVPNILINYIIVGETDGEEGVSIGQIFDYPDYGEPRFISNSIIPETSTLHYVTGAEGDDYYYLYFKYDLDGKYYRISYDKIEYVNKALDLIYTPSESSYIGKTLNYKGKSYTVISDNGTDLEVVGNYLSSGITMGGLAAYNSAITTLNSAAVTASGLSVDGTNVKGIRSIGSSGYSDDDSEDFPNPNPEIFSRYTSNSTKATDLNYEKDLMKLHNAETLRIGDDYWLGSRRVGIDLEVSNLNFYLRVFDGDVGENTMFSMTSSAQDYTYPVRPVVTLSIEDSNIEWND